MHDERAQTLRERATKILETKRIGNTLRNIGELFFTGSYELDLMTWPDVDMQLVLNEGQDPLDLLGGLFTKLSKDEDLIEIQLIHFKGAYKPKMPRGVYLGFKLHIQEYDEIWKFDLWVLSMADFDKNRTLLDSYREKLTPDTRALILELKHEMMAGKERVPQMNSHLLYQVVLLEGVRDKNLIYSRLYDQ